MLIDAGKNTLIAGIVTQSRKKPYGVQYVTSIKVQTSKDKRYWSYVDRGKIFATRNKKNSNAFSSIGFKKAVVARYVRILV
jgi:hypothetical protein